MPDLTPISDESEILSEAQSHDLRPTRPPQINVEPINQASQPDTLNSDQMASGRTTRYPEVPDTLEKQDNGMFSYRLPVFSYVLAWFYIALAAIYAAMLVPYSFMYSSYVLLASTRGNASQSYLVYLPYIAVIIAALLMAWALMRNSLMSRYLGILACLGMIGYEIYSFVQMMSTYSSSINATFGPAVLWSVFSLLLPYLPFYLLPPITLVYLFTPKAVAAYQ